MDYYVINLTCLSTDKLPERRLKQATQVTFSQKQKKVAEESTLGYIRAAEWSYKRLGPVEADMRDSGTQLCVLGERERQRSGRRYARPALLSALTTSPTEQH